MHPSARKSLSSRESRREPALRLPLPERERRRAWPPALCRSLRERRDESFALHLPLRECPRPFSSRKTRREPRRAPSSARQGGGAPCPPLSFPHPGRFALRGRNAESLRSSCPFHREEESLARCLLSAFLFESKGREPCPVLFSPRVPYVSPSDRERRGENLVVRLPRLDRAGKRALFLSAFLYLNESLFWRGGRQNARHLCLL